MPGKLDIHGWLLGFPKGSKKKRELRGLAADAEVPKSGHPERHEPPSGPCEPGRVYSMARPPKKGRVWQQPLPPGTVTLPLPAEPGHLAHNFGIFVLLALAFQGLKFAFLKGYYNILSTSS